MTDAPALPKVLIRAPLGRDEEVLANLLGRHGFEVVESGSHAGFLEHLERGPIDALVLSEEALAPPAVEKLKAVLDAEPAWAALPLVMLIDRPDRVRPALQDLRAVRPALPITVLTRPAPALAVLSAVGTAVRARQAQHTIGRLLEQCRAAEAQARRLLGELDHRTKNLLGTIDALAHQTLGRSVDPRDFQQAFSSRLRAIAQTYDVLSSGEFRSISLTDLAGRILAAFSAGEGRIALDGPDVVLPPGLGQTIGMCLHELGTNAVKYGALSVPEGRLVLTWAMHAPDHQLRLSWREQDGPPVHPPEREGFGSMFIRSSLQLQAGGSADLDFRPDGFCCDLTVQLPDAAGGSIPSCSAGDA
ncbi:MAG TPA: HWE histidine kinase domain-containing protein [Geminicoccaceae bacterium]